MYVVIVMVFFIELQFLIFLYFLSIKDFGLQVINLFIAAFVC